MDTQPTDQVEFLAIGLLQRQVIGQSALPLLRPRQSVAQAFTHRYIITQAPTLYAAGPAPTALSAFVSRAESSTPVFQDFGVSVSAIMPRVWRSVSSCLWDEEVSALLLSPPKPMPSPTKGPLTAQFRKQHTETR